MFDLVSAYKKTIIHQIEFYLNKKIKDYELVIILNEILPFMLNEKGSRAYRDLLNVLAYYNLDKIEAKALPNNYLSEEDLRKEMLKFITISE